MIMLDSSNLIAKIDHSLKNSCQIKNKGIGPIKLIKKPSNNYAIIKQTDMPSEIIYS